MCIVQVTLYPLQMFSIHYLPQKFFFYKRWQWSDVYQEFSIKKEIYIKIILQSTAKSNQYNDLHTFLWGRKLKNNSYMAVYSRPTIVYKKTVYSSNN